MTEVEAFAEASESDHPTTTAATSRGTAIAKTKSGVDVIVRRRHRNVKAHGVDRAAVRLRLRRERRTGGRSGREGPEITVAPETAGSCAVAPCLKPATARAVVECAAREIRRGPRRPGYAHGASLKR